MSICQTFVDFWSIRHFRWSRLRSSRIRNTGAWKFLICPIA